MAYLASFREKEEEKLKNSEQQSGTEKVLSSGGGYAGTGAGAGQKGGGSQAGRPGFTNLQAYLNANTGQNAQNMATRVADKVTADAGAAETAIKDTEKEFAGNVEKNTVKLDPSLTSAVKTNASSVVNDPTKKAAFEAQMGATYQGPEGLSDASGYQTAAQKLNAAKGTVGRLANDEGRQTLLKDVYNRGNYSRGEQQLDSYIFGGSNEGRQQLDSLQTRFKDIGNWLGNAETTAKTKVDAAKATTDATRQAANQALAEAGTDITGQLSSAQQSVDQFNAGNKGAYNSLVADLSSGNWQKIRPHLKDLGMHEETAAALFGEGFDFTKLINAPTAERTLGDVATPEQQAQLNALAALGGEVDPASYNFGKSSGEYTHSVKTDKSKLADDAFGRQGLLMSQLLTENDRRKSSQQFIEDGIRAGNPEALAKVGLTPEDWQFAQQFDIDPVSFLSKGRDLSVGDLASDKDRALFQDLSTYLGVNLGDFVDPGDEGGAYSYDAEGLRGAYGQKKSAAEAEAARLAEEETARAALEAEKAAADEAAKKDASAAPVPTSSSSPVPHVGTGTQITPVEEILGKGGVVDTIGRSIDSVFGKPGKKLKKLFGG